MRRNALQAVVAPTVQAAISLVLQLLVSRLLGVDNYGRFAILYGVIVLATGAITGLVGDSLVVLDRGERRVRAGLELMLLCAAFVLGVVAGFVTWLTRFTSPLEAVVFGVALMAFTIEEIVRRLLMAHMTFLKVALTDLSGFVIACGVIGAVWATHDLNLVWFMAAIALGQVLACWVGWRMVAKPDRYLVGLCNADLLEVWRYGVWRSMQQTLRPGLFTATRLLVAGFVGLAGVGHLEGARTYTSPLVLVIGGLSSFLFVRFAHQHKAGASGTLREADRLAVILTLASVVMSAIAIPLAAPVGRIAFGFPLDAVAVIAWLAYGTTVAVVTPYGALSAVSGHQSVVFLIRLGDTLTGLAIAVIMLALGVSWMLVPFGLAASSLLGGAGLRWFATRTRSARVPETAARQPAV